MDLISSILIIASIHFLAAASPGPDFVLVSQQSLKYGKKTGLFVSLGITLGLSIHILYSAVGLSAIIANSETALWVIKILGAGYLFYLGVMSLKSPAKATVEISESISSDIPTAKSSLFKGFLCNALNPKAPIYFVALFTLVITPDTPVDHLMVYSIVMMVIQMAWFSSVSLLLSRPSVNKAFQSMGHWLDRLMGLALIGLGIKILFTKLQP